MALVAEISKYCSIKVAGILESKLNRNMLTLILAKPLTGTDLCNFHLDL